MYTGRSFAALFRDIVLLGMPLVSTHCDGPSGCGCTDHEALFGVKENDVQLEQELAACKASASDCRALCEAARTTKAPQVRGDEVSVVSCKLVSVEDGGLFDGSADKADATTDAGASSTRKVVAVYRVCVTDCASGRFPAAAAHRQSLTALRPEHSRASWFRAMARLEAASVVAFQELARELEAHRAPQDLIDAAWRARDDEIRHTEVASSLAGESTAPLREFDELLGRSLEQLAVLNASEGCVRETFGALLATYQAHHAGDGRVRSALREIAADECRHAELAWDLRAWFDEQLTATSRARVREAERVAWAMLEVSLEHGLSASLATDIGLPALLSLQRLFRELQKALTHGNRLALRGMNGGGATRHGSSTCPSRRTAMLLDSVSKMSE